MAEERPPTPEEIQTLRSRISDVSENEDGKNLSLNMAHLVLYILISRFNHISSACMESLDISRLMNDDSYIARFFLHCTDVPGESLFLNIITSSF